MGELAYSDGELLQEVYIEEKPPYNSLNRRKSWTRKNAR